MNTTEIRSYWRLICFTALILLTSCAPLSGSKEEPPSEAVVKARQQIAQNRENTQLLVQRIKRKYERRETQAAYVKARDLYDAAMVQNNSWVTSLKLGIANKEDLEASQAFRDKAKAAGDATTAFLDFGHTLTRPGGEVKVLTSQAVGEVIKILVENGIVIWKAHLAEQQAARLAAAERTEKELKWSSWENVK